MPFHRRDARGDLRVEGASESAWPPLEDSSLLEAQQKGYLFALVDVPSRCEFLPVMKAMHFVKIWNVSLKTLRMK